MGAFKPLLVVLAGLFGVTVVIVLWELLIDCIFYLLGWD